MNRVDGIWIVRPLQRRAPVLRRRPFERRSPQTLRRYEALGQDHARKDRSRATGTQAGAQAGHSRRPACSPREEAAHQRQAPDCQRPFGAAAPAEHACQTGLDRPDLVTRGRHALLTMIQHRQRVGHGRRWSTRSQARTTDHRPFQAENIEQHLFGGDAR